MTVKELIIELQKIENQELPVVISVPQVNPNWILQDKDKTIVVLGEIRK